MRRPQSLEKMTKRLLSRGLPKVMPRKEGGAPPAGHLLRLTKSPTMGWTVVTTRDIEPGTVLLRESPLVAALYVNLEAVPELLPLARIAVGLPDVSTKYGSLVAPMLLRGVTDDWLGNFCGVPVTENEGGLATILSELKKRKSVLGSDRYLPQTTRLAIRALEVVKANSFVLTSPIAGIEFASALYDFSSLFNHSCSPNVLAFNDGGKSNMDLVVVATAHIPKGREVFLTYGNALVLNVDIRRVGIERIFGFLCKCQRCEAELATFSKSSPPPPPFRCRPDILKMFQKAISFMDRGLFQEGFVVLADVLKNHKKALCSSETDPNIRLQIVVGCVRGCLKWGWLEGDRRLEEEDLAFLRHELDSASDGFKVGGLSISLHAVAYSHLLECMEACFSINTRDGGRATPATVRKIVNCQQRAMDALSTLHGKAEYYTDVDLALSQPFQRIMRIVRRCVKIVDAGA